MFSNWLKARMEEVGITQMQLARACGVSQAAVSRWTRGQTRPGGPKIVLLARALGVSLDEVADLLLQSDAPASHDLSIEDEIAALRQRLDELEHRQAQATTQQS